MVMRRVILHVGWPKTATTTLQHQLRRSWPNLAGRPWDRPGGESSRSLLRGAVHTGQVTGDELDALLEVSWHRRELPVVLSSEDLIGIRPWQHGRSKLPPTAVADLVAATSWPASVLMTLRAPRPLIRSNYRYAVAGGYERSYATYLGEERAALDGGVSPFAIRAVVESWVAAFGNEAVAVRWMEDFVGNPRGFWDSLALEFAVPDLSRVGRAPLDHRNPTSLGPLAWELQLNRILRSKSDRRRAVHTHRLRRFHTRRIGPVLSRFADGQLDGGDPEQELVERMEADVAWVRQRFPTSR
jgi:hypothetical protein